MARARVAQIDSPAVSMASAQRRRGASLQESPSRAHETIGREMLGLRERKKVKLRQQIIETAIRLFRKQGYENTRVEDVVRILEISQTTFFRYFPSKADRPLWQAVVLSGAMDPVRSPDMRGRKEAATGLLREILAAGQARGEISRAFPAEHLAEFMDGVYNTVVRQWAVDLTGPHKLSERVSSAVEFFLRGVRP